MCKRCSELEIEIEAAEEYGFGLTSFQLQEELEALQASHLPNNRVHADAGDSAVSTGIVNASAESTSQAESAPTQRG